MVKVVSVVRFFSILLFLGVLAFVYAYLPVQVKLLPEGNDLLVSRDTFFYSVASIFLLVNVAFVILSRVLEKPLRRISEELFMWLKAGSPAVNIYITLLVGFVGVINNPLHISARSYGYLNILGPLALLLWIGGLLYSALKAKRLPSEG